MLFVLPEVFSLVLGPSFDSDGKESACNAGDLGSIPRLGRSPRGGNETHSSIGLHSLLLKQELPGRTLPTHIISQKRPRGAEAWVHTFSGIIQHTAL